MPIVSWQFAAFVAAALLIYYLLPHRLQNIWLLVLSAVFYAWLGWQFIIVLAVLIAANWLIAHRLSARTPHRLTWLWAGITLNVLILALFKYFDFFEAQVQTALGQTDGSAASGALALILPVGLSFTILQTISFLVDVHKGQIDPLPRPLDFALYLAYFPKLTSGPIERARSFIPKLTEPRMVDNDRFARSFSLVMVGLFRKIVVANQLDALIPGIQFVRPAIGSNTGVDAALYVLAYGFYLYNDFAGYTSIVRGVSGFFGIELSANFLTPFFSRSFTEFWNQWHISLSEWLRDYIYLPLTRAFLRRNANPRFILTLVIPPLTTMIVSGLWHNVSLSLLIWGALHGLYLVIERVISAHRPARRPDQQPLLWQVASGAMVFILANLAWIPFHTTGLIRMRNYLLALARPGWPGDALPVLNFIAFSLFLDIVQRRTGRELFFMQWSRPAQAALLTVTCLVLLVMSADTTPSFVYQGF